ncbi:MAG: hypothetical protein M1821_007947 [Bathelium mastoideum]|nr:MAG: hypothetical protein M1821_007947 [Bathelium mastoideum]
MADPEIQIEVGEGGAVGDVDMGETEAADNGVDDSGLQDIEADSQPRRTFLDYLKSPMVELVIGQGDETTSLTAHQGLLVQCPFFVEACSQFSDGAARRVINLATEDLDAMGCFLEYLYTQEYFPRLLGPATSASSTLERDPSFDIPDSTGNAILRHARVYTLASRFGLPSLRSLAHAKIHRTESTARGEIAYARYVYKETAMEDATIRRPVAAFWANRSYVLRHEAEDEFRRMCLEFPQFGFDVLSLVLDEQEKRKARTEAAASVATPGGSARKRARISNI